jgi:hypothetical protein
MTSRFAAPSVEDVHEGTEQLRHRRWDMANIPVEDRSGPGHQIIWNEYGDKMVISDNGSRVDV